MVTWPAFRECHPRNEREIRQLQISGSSMLMWIIFWHNSQSTHVHHGLSRGTIPTLASLKVWRLSYFLLTNGVFPFFPLLGCFCHKGVGLHCTSKTKNDGDLGFNPAHWSQTIMISFGTTNWKVIYDSRNIYQQPYGSEMTLQNEANFEAFMFFHLLFFGPFLSNRSLISQHQNRDDLQSRHEYCPHDRQRQRLPKSDGIHSFGFFERPI